MSILTIVILAGLALLAVIFGASLIGTFNKLVTLKNRYQNAFAQIEVQCARPRTRSPSRARPSTTR